jgi:hypothetical protein
VPTARHDADSAGAYHHVCAYTLTLGDPAFIHQHVVDAFAAQTADAWTKPIGLTFALVGLYLLVEKQFSGRHVQRVHMALARHKEPWPRFALPEDRGPMTAADVVAAPPGPDRDRAIHAWCASVWAAYGESHGAVAHLLERHQII